MTITKLTAENVDETIRYCLYKDIEVVNGPPADAVLADGIVRRFGLHPGRLAERTEAIVSMLKQLPAQFQEKSGGGWSFLNACNDLEGHQWTGEHRMMEALFVLGMAIGRVKCLMPRDKWSVLPGGMPYYAVTESP